MKSGKLLKRISPKNRFIILYLSLNLLLSVFYIDKGINWNSISRILPIMSYFEQGNFQIDKYKDKTGDLSFVNGHYYTDKAPLASMIVLPVYKVLVSSGIIVRNNSWDDLVPIGFLASFLCGTLPFLFLLYLMMKHLMEVKSKISPVLLVLLSVYGSMLFVFSSAFFSHLLAGAFILSAYLLLKKKRFFWAGFLCGMAFASEFPLGVFLPIWAFIILVREQSFKKSLFFSIGSLPFILLILFYNYYFTGSPFSMLYNFEAQQGFADEFNQANTIFGFGLPRLENVWEMLFGQYKGLLFYMPILAFFVFQYFKEGVKIKFKKLFSSYLILPSIIFALLIVSKSYSWWGGWTYGPRYLIPLCFLLVYEGTMFISKQNFSKKWFYGITAFGLLCAWMAKSTVMFSIPTEEKYPVFGYVVSKFNEGAFNQNNILSMLFGIDPQWAAYSWLGLFIGSSVLLVYLYKRMISNKLLG